MLDPNEFFFIVYKTKGVQSLITIIQNSRRSMWAGQR